MTPDFLDAEILNDFLTEAAELIDELDADLVTLEETPGDEDLLNRIFRALHTVKGSASFLAITNLVEFAHKAEDALNVIRKGEVRVTEPVMDALLRSVDVLRLQIGQLQEGNEPEAAPDDLLSALIAIARNEINSAEGDASVESSVSSEGSGCAKGDGGVAVTANDTVSSSVNAGGTGEIPLSLSDSKQDLVVFMVEDIGESLDQIEEEIHQLEQSSLIAETAEDLTEIATALSRSAEFFEFASMVELVGYLEVAGQHLGEVSEELLGQIVPRMSGILVLLRAQHEALGRGMVRTFDASQLGNRLVSFLQGEAVGQESYLAAGASARDALEHDGVVFDDEGAGEATDALIDGESRGGGEQDDVLVEGFEKRKVEVGATADGGVVGDAVVASTPTGTAKNGGQKKGGGKRVLKSEPTIRVEVGRLEILLNLVGELVIQKNRIAALSRQISHYDGLPSELQENVAQASRDLDHITSQIQVGVMRTRMQPLDKLFGKYPRLIRDLARSTGKKFDLKIEGGDTEVDKSILEELGDPLVHILRNSADHGIEDPSDRIASGKPETGTICIKAKHQGSHVEIEVSDDGKGLNREVLGRKAVEKGIITEEELPSLSDHEIIHLIMAPGFSTAEQVSDLSGRGVGMDVVRTNIQSLGGDVELNSVECEGTTLTIKIPLTVAILNAMMVEVGGDTYAIPLTNILEIAKPDEGLLSTINGRSVLRLRERVIPIVDMKEVFGGYEEGTDSRFAVIVGTSEQPFGLMVTGLIGQQEIVIKPLDESIESNEMISGATVREDGGVSLILDVMSIIERTAKSGRAAA